VNDGILEATGPLEPSTLSKAERVLVGILRNHGGVLQGAELSRYAGEAGVGNAMAQQALLRSPLFLKYGGGRYGLPGWGEPELETRRVPTGEIVWFGESEVEITAASGASADASLDGPPMPICPTRDAHLDTQVVVRTTASVEEHLKTALRDLTERQRGINEELSRIDSLRAESETIAKQIDAVNLTLQVFADDPRGRSPEGSKRRAQQKQNIQTFVVDSENRITAFDSAEAASASVGERFGNWSELVALAATWPAQRLVSVWNGLAGIKPVKRFQDRQEGVGRIWKRLQRVYPF